MKFVILLGFCVTTQELGNSFLSLYNLLVNNEIRNEVIENIENAVENLPYFTIEKSLLKDKYALLTIQRDFIELKTSNEVFKKDISQFIWSSYSMTDELCAVIVNIIKTMCQGNLKGDYKVAVDVFSEEKVCRANINRNEREEKFLNQLKTKCPNFKFFRIDYSLKNFLKPDSSGCFLMPNNIRKYVFTLDSGPKMINYLIYKEKELRKHLNSKNDKKYNEDIEILDLKNFIIWKIETDQKYAKVFLQTILYSNIKFEESAHGFEFNLLRNLVCSRKS